MNTENNKLFAEFLELLEISNETYPILYKDKNSDEWFAPDELKYHSDWNWLMEVVKKIFSEECIKPFAGNGMYYVLELKIEEALKKAKIEPVYNACVEFIKWYNEKK